MSAHASIEIELFRSDHAGRAEPLPAGTHQLLAGMFGAFHAVQIELSDLLCPGEKSKVLIPVTFLAPHRVLPYIAAGQQFMLREQRIIGHCTVVAVHQTLSSQDAHPQNDSPPFFIVSSDGWVVCPCCKKRFTVSDKKRWNGERHMSCGQRITLQPA